MSIRKQMQVEVSFCFTNVTELPYYFLLYFLSACFPFNSCLNTLDEGVGWGWGGVVIVQNILDGILITLKSNTRKHHQRTATPKILINIHHSIIIETSMPINTHQQHSSGHLNPPHPSHKYASKRLKHMLTSYTRLWACIWVVWLLTTNHYPSPTPTSPLTPHSSTPINTHQHSSTLINIHHPHKLMPINDTFINIHKHLSALVSTHQHPSTPVIYHW